MRTGDSPACYGLSPTQPEPAAEPPYPASVCRECFEAATVVAPELRITYCAHHQAAAVWRERQWTVLTPCSRAEYISLLTGQRGTA